jgi:hypothetical protein
VTGRHGRLRRCAACPTGRCPQNRINSNRRYWHLVDQQQKPAAKAAVAVGWELVGFVLAMWQDVLSRRTEATSTAA